MELQELKKNGNMKPYIQTCSHERTTGHHCPHTNKGWGCRFLVTPITDTPTTEKEKAKLFSAVYREAKQKGVLECPHYHSLLIDEVLERLSSNT